MGQCGTYILQGLSPGYRYLVLKCMYCTWDKDEKQNTTVSSESGPDKNLKTLLCRFSID